MPAKSRARRRAQSRGWIRRCQRKRFLFCPQAMRDPWENAPFFLEITCIGDAIAGSLN